MNVAGGAVSLVARALTGVRVIWKSDPAPWPRLYVANHSSQIDFVLVWSALPAALRVATRPVAGSDYWLKTPLRRFFGQRVFNAVLIDRNKETRVGDPIADMAAAMDQGASLIIFPEGTRNLTADQLLPLKSGIYHLARRRPGLELVPVWIENLNRVMPKGEIVPVPLLCTVTFGEVLRLDDGETKDAFLARCRDAMLALAPGTKAS